MDRYHGFWWSPCGTMMVYTEVNENHIPTFDILHQVLLLHPASRLFSMVNSNSTYNKYLCAGRSIFVLQFI